MAKSEDEATQVGGWYGEGTALVRGNAAAGGGASGSTSGIVGGSEWEWGAGADNARWRMCRMGTPRSGARCGTFNARRGTPHRYKDGGGVLAGIWLAGIGALRRPVWNNCANVVFLCCDSPMPIQIDMNANREPEMVSML